MYNLKLLRYPNGVVRLVYYDREIREDYQVKKNRIKNPFDGELTEEAPWAFSDYKPSEHSFEESMRRTKTAVYDYSMCTDWELFITLTFDSKKVDRYDYDACVKAMNIFLKYARRKCPDIKYLIVPEQHKDAAYHFHGLLANCKDLPLADSGIVQNGRIVYNIVGYKVGFSTATKVSDSRKSGTYLTKYITKDMCVVSRNRKRYWHSRNLSLPSRDVFTVDFGDKEMALDTLFASSSYYKECGYDEYKSYFFEFPPGVEINPEMFVKFAYSFSSK